MVPEKQLASALQVEPGAPTEAHGAVGGRCTTAGDDAVSGIIGLSRLHKSRQKDLPKPAKLFGLFASSSFSLPQSQQASPPHDIDRAQ